MRDVRLFIAIACAILVSLCSSDSLSLEENAQDEPLRMASDSLVVKSYKTAESSSPPPTDSDEEKSNSYQTYQGVMGRPGVDYPVFSGIPVTSFSCRNVKKSGYYADLETDCQVFHVCDRNRKISFLCPNGTIFRQSHLICDWWFRVDCGRSVELYDESAEQLEADQQVYKGRSEERESRRRKQSRVVTSRKNGETTSSKDQSGQRRKPERNSKKVSDFNRDQLSAHFNGNENIQFKNHEKGDNNFTFDEGQINPKGSNSDQQQLDELTSSQNHNYGQNLQSIRTNNNKESFYEAESGSFVEDLSGRSRNYAASLKNGNNNFRQTQQRQNNFGANSSQKRTSKKLDLNARERNEYFSSNKQVTEHKVESFSEEKSSSSYESSGNQYQGFTSSTGTGAGGNNRQEERTNQEFNQYRDNQSNNQNSAFGQSEQQKSNLVPDNNPRAIQSSQIVQNNYISTQVIGQDFQNDNGKIQSILTSSNNTAVRQNVFNNGVSNSKQLVYSSTSVTDEQPGFSGHKFEQVTETEKNGNVNFDFGAATRTLHNSNGIPKQENAGNFESRFNTFSSTSSSFVAGNTNQNFGNTNTESVSSHTSNQPSPTQGVVKFSSSFRKNGQSSFDRAKSNHNFRYNNDENFKSSFETRDFAGQQNSAYNDGDANAAYKYTTITSSANGGNIPTHSETSSPVGQQSASSDSGKSTQTQFQTGSFSIGQSNANNGFSGNREQFDYSTASTILPSRSEENKNINHNLGNSHSLFGSGGSSIGQNINFNENTENDSHKTPKIQFGNNFNVNGFVSTTPKPTYTTATSFSFNNDKFNQGFGAGNGGSVQAKPHTSFTTNSQQSIVNDGLGRTNHFEYTTTPSTNQYQTADAGNNGKENFNFGFSTTTVKPINTFNGITGNGKTSFSFGTYKENENYEYSSNIPFSTVQQSHLSSVVNNGNTAFGSNIKHGNQQPRVGGVQDSVTGLEQTTPTTQSIFRQVNSAFSFSNFNSNNNNLQSNQNTVNNNFGSSTSSQTSSQGASFFNGIKNVNGDYGSAAFGSVAPPPSQNDDREAGHFGFGSQQNGSPGSFYNQHFGSTNKNTDYNTANINHNTEVKQINFEGSYAQSKNENSARPQVVNQIRSTSFAVNTGLGDDSASIFTTETYESKRTNPIVRKETTLTPTTQSPYYLTSQRSSPSFLDEEKQYLAETASFGSNPGGSYYSDFKNQLDVSDKGNRIDVTTEKFYQTTYEISGSTDSYLTRRPVTNQFSTESAHLKTISTAPLQQNSENVYFASTSSIKPLDEARFITTARPLYETTTPPNVRNTAEDVFYAPTVSTNAGDEAQKFDLSFGLENRSLSSEVNLSLQELSINKDVLQANASGKTYEDLVREGLEVPPSSGPNAIRSFALYFGTKNSTNDNETITSHPVTHHADLSPTISSFQLKKKEVVKQVDELVQQGSINATGTSTLVPSSQGDKLPNSLTVHTQETYLELFPKGNEDANVKETTTEAHESNSVRGEFEFGTTDFGAFTEEPTVINSELGLNDLDLSQSRGLLEPEPSDASNTKSSNAHVTHDLRRLAQVFTKALSAYLDDPHAFKKILSEIRPTEPTIDLEENTFAGSDYPSATQEVDEVLDFSDVTKSTHKKKFPTTVAEEITTEPVTEIYNSSLSEFENLIFPLNQSSWATNIELTAPVLETLDESQSSYYTPPPFTGTTNQVAEEINGFITSDKSSTYSEESEDVDSYLPATTNDPTAKYGGFQNNNKKTTKYSPYGAELSSTPFPPLGINSFSKAAEAKSDVAVPTSTDGNSGSFFSHFTQNRTQEDEIQLAKELNNLVLLQKFTTPRGTTAESTTAQPNLSTSHLTTGNEAPQYLDVKLGNGETLEREASTNRGGKNLYLPGVKSSNYFEPTAREINLELSPVSSTPKGFLITYSLSNQETSSRQPTFTKLDVQPTTYAPERVAPLSFVSETAPPLDLSGNLSLSVQSYLEYNGVPVESTTPQFARSIKSLERIVELQEALMFNTSNSTVQQKDEAREMVDQMVGSVNVTTSTTQTLMKMMEMAAKNETYKRLVLLLVNDKSAKNKTVEEARLSLLKALLTPVISPEKSVVPISTTSKLVQKDFNDHVGSPRRSKSIRSDATGNPVFTTTSSSTVPPTATTIKTTTTTATSTKTNTLASTATTPSPPTSVTATKARRTKITKIIVRNENNRKKPDLGNIDILRRTIENSKNKQVNFNSIDESAILSSDSRAVELLKSLYSLAARWG